MKKIVLNYLHKNDLKSMRSRADSMARRAAEAEAIQDQRDIPRARDSKEELARKLPIAEKKSRERSVQQAFESARTEAVRTLNQLKGAGTELKARMIKKLEELTVDDETMQAFIDSEAASPDAPQTAIDDLVKDWVMKQVDDIIGQRNEIAAQAARELMEARRAAHAKAEENKALFGGGEQPEGGWVKKGKPEDTVEL